MLASYHWHPFTSFATTIAKVAIGVWQTFTAIVKQKLAVSGVADHAYYFLHRHRLQRLELPMPRPEPMLTAPGQLVTVELRRRPPPASLSTMLKQITFSLSFSTSWTLVVKLASFTMMVANAE